MSKKYLITSLVYACIAMGGGVFYREFTKYLAFSGVTRLSVFHTHYFLMGMFFFLLLALLEKVFSFSGKHTGKIVVLYHIGLNITGCGLLARGLCQVLMPELSSGLNGAISGIAGCGHILLGLSVILLLVTIIKRAGEPTARSAA
ncbi:MAG: DUF2871 family protein [Oscillospiraceae bacterium]|nr:DUF2871 family protein [Oscillospiraceae bacterium]